MTNQASIPGNDIANSATSASDDAAIALSVAAADRMLKRMPPEVRESFGPAHRHALGMVLTEAKPSRLMVNLRFTLLGIFFALTVGRENRSVARQKQERLKHPLFTPGNVIVMLLTWPVGILLGWATYVFLLHGQI